jgi:hypothetical protein
MTDEFGRLQATPATLGGTTQSPYIVVPDADMIYRRAKAAGAEIVVDIKDEDYGGRVFSCRDPEGHLWNIGTYDPWKAPQWVALPHTGTTPHCAHSFGGASVAPIKTTCSRRGPCAPRMRVCSMSAERDGPVTRLIARGKPSAPNWSRRRASTLS